MMKYDNKMRLLAIPQDTLIRLILFFCGILVTATSLLNLFHTNAGIDYASNETTYQEERVLPIQETANIEAVPVQDVKNNMPSIQNQTSTVTKGTTLTNLLLKQGVNPQEVRLIQTQPQAHNYLSSIRAGQKFEITFSPDHHVNTLKYNLTPEKHLMIKNIKQHFQSELVEKDMITKMHSISVSVTTSIATAMKKAGISAKLAHELNQVIPIRTIQKGAHLNILYEGVYKGGKLAHIGNIYGVKLTNGKNNKSTYVLQNIDQNGEVNYYDLEGKSLKPAFLRAPLHYRTISSPFNLHRMHPILRYVRPHTGVDLSAPSGTPVVASSDGKVTFVGSEGGYGRVIKIQHTQPYSTVFAHLSGFAKNLKHGMHVQKGQVIGYVGRTGLADGPHLHYEVRISGKPVNPMTVKLPQAQGVPKAQKSQYTIYANQLARDYLIG